ncbi:hypothetical protein [Azospirillum thiophilum]|uniref:hypothetical protein n=1 Tax=Azospirillum thiophilum TaxID=528244 RepID=UPI0013964445|nr:hypothetical protein [Azospirillum thiophilum]
MTVLFPENPRRSTLPVTVPIVAFQYLGSFMHERTGHDFHPEPLQFLFRNICSY